MLYESRLSGSSFVVSCIAVRCGPRLPTQSSSSLSSLWPPYANCLLHLSPDPLQPHQSFFSALFLFSSFLQSDSHNFSDILQIFILSIRLYHPNSSDFINFTMLAPRNISLPPYCSCSPAFFFFYVTINCSYTHPFEYSNNIHLF